MRDRTPHGSRGFGRPPEYATARIVTAFNPCPASLQAMRTRHAKGPSRSFTVSEWLAPKFAKRHTCGHSSPGTGPNAGRCRRVDGEKMSKRGSEELDDCIRPVNGYGRRTSQGRNAAGIARRVGTTRGPHSRWARAIRAGPRPALAILTLSLVRRRAIAATSGSDLWRS